MVYLPEDEAYYRTYRETWGPGPHVTADAVVVSGDGHVLLIRRGRPPGQGLLAVPGGFLNLDERIIDAAMRELAEEAGIGAGGAPISRKVLEGTLRSSQVFDDPERSRRGRVITHAFLFSLPHPHNAYSIAAGDDAAEAAWHRPADLGPEQMFEDHWQILSFFNVV